MELKFSKKNQRNSLISKEFSGNSLFTSTRLATKILLHVRRFLDILLTSKVAIDIGV